MLTLVERKTRKQIVTLIESKTQESAIKELNKIEKKYGKAKFKNTFKSITADNGVEFLNQDLMEKSSFKTGSKTKIYFCHAYCSWERGSNEKVNKLVRRWIPKGTSLDNFKKIYIKK